MKRIGLLVRLASAKPSLRMGYHAIPAEPSSAGDSARFSGRGPPPLCPPGRGPRPGGRLPRGGLPPLSGRSPRGVSTPPGRCPGGCERCP